MAKKTKKEKPYKYDVLGFKTAKALKDNRYDVLEAGITNSQAHKAIKEHENSEVYEVVSIKTRDFEGPHTKIDYPTNKLQIKLGQKLFHKAPKILEKKEGKILKVKRGRDGVIVSVGMKTLYGVVKELKPDTHAGGNMSVIFEEAPGTEYGLANLVLTGEDEKD